MSYLIGFLIGVAVCFAAMVYDEYRFWGKL